MSHTSIKRPLFFVVMVCAFASGCVGRAVYDESWAEQVKVESDACPAIDGVYQNAGERFAKAKHDTHERRAVSLAHLLNGGNYYLSHQADDQLGQTFEDPAEDPYQTVSLRLEEGKMNVEASLADGSTRAFDLPTRQQCRDSTLLLESDWGNSGTAIKLSVIERTTLALGRAEDGSLLVHGSESSVFFILFLPFSAGTYGDWTRFPPVAAVPPLAPEQISGLTP